MTTNFDQIILKTVECGVYSFHASMCHFDKSCSLPPRSCSSLTKHKCMQLDATLRTTTQIKLYKSKSKPECLMPFAKNSAPSELHTKVGRNRCLTDFAQSSGL